MIQHGKESTEVQTTQKTGKERGNSYWKMKRSPDERHTQTYESLIEKFHTYIYSLLIEKDIYECWNISIKLSCVCAFRPEISSFFGKGFPFLFLLCEICNMDAYLCEFCTIMIQHKYVLVLPKTIILSLKSWKSSLYHLSLCSPSPPFCPSSQSPNISKLKVGTDHQETDQHQNCKLFFQYESSPTLFIWNITKLYHILKIIFFMQKNCTYYLLCNPFSEFLHPVLQTQSIHNLISYSS